MPSHPRRFRASLVVGSALIASLVAGSSASAASLAGKVVAVGHGGGVARAAVTLTLGEKCEGPKATTVFTDDEGRFRFPGDHPALPEGARLEARKLGYEPVRPESGEPRATKNEKSGDLEVTLFVDAVGDIADQVPASAWLADMPESREKDILVTSCTSCHQVPSPKMREYAAKIEAVKGGPEGDAKALEEWRKVVRHEAWRTIVKYMRSMHYAVFPLESPMNIGVLDWGTLQNADLNFFNEKQGEIIAKYLAEHFPTSTQTLPDEAYGYGAPIGATERTVIREYQFPEMALVREMVGAPNSPYFWGVDVRRNLLVRVDPESGATKWIEVDFEGSTGPHTIAPDDEGKLWVTMIDHDQFGRYDPETGKWDLWTLRPTNLGKDASMAGAAIVHDLSIDSRGHTAADPDGNIWLTMVGTNQMGTIQPETGEVAFYDTNRVEGMSAINHLMYGTVLSAGGKEAWYSQLNGHVGCLDTKTKKLTKLVEFPEGAGPRRMTRDDAGHLYVALFGSGQVAKIDMAKGKVAATFDLPDRGSAPYAVSWDEKRQVVWVANANSDVLYRLDPKSGKSLVYPLPRAMAYLRQVHVHGETGQLVAAYGNYPEGSGPSMGVVIEVGD